MPAPASSSPARSRKRRVSEPRSTGSSRRCVGPVAAEPQGGSSDAHREVRRGHVLFRSPSPLVNYALMLLASAALAALLFLPDVVRFAEGFFLVGLLPALLASAITTPLCAALGGWLEFHR